MLILQKEEVNTGRQRELDLVKGFLMIMIVFIHSFQIIANQTAIESEVYKLMFAFFMPTGACLYLFCMGFGSVFSRRSQPGDLAKNGLKLLCYQALSNIIYSLCLIIFFHLRNAILGEVEGTIEAYHESVYGMITFVNIFFISGMCYFVLAIYKAIRMPLVGYIISAVVVGILSPYMGTICSENEALNWILDMSFGGKGETSFCFFPYLSYVFMGYVFAKVIRKIQEKDKAEFYIKSGIVSAVIVAIWMGFVIWNYPSVDEFFTYMILQYRIPGIAKVIGSCCSILLCFAIAYGAAPIIEKWKFGYRKLTEYSKNISKLYAVHIGIFLIIQALLSFVGVGTAACFGWAVIVLLLTDLTVKGYIAIEKRIVHPCAS